MTRTACVLFTLFSLTAFAQENPTEQAKPIVAEGKKLYKSEMASWYGTDLFIENYKDRGNIGGYFSYLEKDSAKCIFFSKGDKPKVIGTISFDYSYDLKNANVDLTEREFSKYEAEVHTIRNLALQIITSDTLFRTFKNTNLNLIPLVSEEEKKVYVLTGTSQNNVVIFGNDYLISFDKDNKLTGKKRLHNNIIPVSYGEKENAGQDDAGTIHSHLPETGDFMTATDICTLMLYQNFTKWKQHTVVSKKYLNIWNCQTGNLLVLPMETVDKINKDQETRSQKKND